MLGSRPDLSFSITYSSQFQNSYNSEHWRHLKHILRYLKITQNFGLRYVKLQNYNSILSSYVDADFANDQNNRKSITGYVIKHCNNAII